MPPELVPPALVVTVLEAPEVVFLCLTVPPPPPALGEEPDVGDRPPPPTLVALAAGPGCKKGEKGTVNICQA